LLALDLDGTIVDEHLAISPRVRRALHQAQQAGVHVTLASGRPFYEMRLFAEELGIHEPLIAYQGAVVQDPVTGQVYFHRGVPLHLAHEFVVFARRRSWSQCLFVDGKIYADQITPGVQFYAGFSPAAADVQQVDRLEDILSREPTKLVVIVEAQHGAQVSELLQARFGHRLSIVRSFPRFVEATNLAASKGQALSFLARRLGVSRGETMAIGDNDNDADMVAWAGLGVAMGNASAAVKAAADHVAAAVAGDGAAEAIERFVLEHVDG
jgi:Cof subfamily protein (haloacid dehalogenase superfamily)